MTFEGGFNGRSNKLVDGCYCFWVGAAIALLDIDFYPPEAPHSNLNTNRKFDSGVYNRRIDPLLVTRLSPDLDNLEPSSNKHNGSYCDPEKGNLTFDQILLQRYIMLCAQDPQGGLRDKPSKGRDFYHSCYNLSGLSVSQHVLSTSDTGHQLYQSEQSNLLGATHPVYNIRVERVQSIVKSFKGCGTL